MNLCLSDIAVRGQDSHMLIVLDSQPKARGFDALPSTCSHLVAGACKRRVGEANAKNSKHMPSERSKSVSRYMIYTKTMPCLETLP